MSDQLYMPEREAAFLKMVYRKSKVILEYGSGGSTRLAAGMPDKLIMSVESDLAWTRSLRHDLMDARSPVILQHVDIGDTGLWGRPVDDRSWRNYHRYPNSVWDEPWFRQPDVVLIDGRFRTACLASVILRTRKSVRVLFDDYAVRDRYQMVEGIIEPYQMIGRMAEFRVKPGNFSPKDMGFLIEQYFQMTVDGEGEKAYRVPKAKKRTKAAAQKAQAGGVSS